MSSQFRQKWTLFVCWFVFFSVFCAKEQNQVETINNQQIEKQELRIEQEFKNQIDTQLQEWIVQQNDWNAQYPQIQTHESFIFKLSVQSQYDFRMKSSLSTNKLISVSVFLAQNNEDIIIPQNPDIQSFVQVLTSNTKSGLQKSQGNVYIQKVFQIQFTETYKYLRIVSNLKVDALIIVNMEQYDFTVNSKVSDDKFYIAKTKIQAIKKQIQATQTNRQHMFKFQWGFYDKRQRHQRDMLELTGAQLTAIIVTSIVQMYCIKNLIGHQLIV